MRGLADRLTSRLATGGLVLVLVALTAFSVTAAVNNVRVSAEAQRSAAVSHWAAQAEQSLLAEEDAADDLVAGGGAAAREEYEAASRATRTALEATGRAAEAGHAAHAAEWLELHATYQAAVARLVVLAAGDPEAAEAYEEASVDPHYEAIADVLQEEVEAQRVAAGASLDELGRSQRVLLLATPVVFGAGLALLGVFLRALTRSRSQVAAQAEENRRQALHDALTGLPNRTLLHQEGAAALRAAAAQGSGPTVALLLVDLDRFKEINDTLGHAYGDVVLIAVAERLTAAVRAGGTIARLSGDEFAVLLPTCAGEADALEAARRVHRALQRPVQVEGVLLSVEASVGVVVAEPGLDAIGVLLQRADIAMYAAKQRGAGVCLYGPEFDVHNAERLNLLGELRRAVEGDELVLHYQPQISLPHESVEAVEALVRWQHPERGLLPPGVFIPLAERTALVHPLTRFVVDAALQQCRRWRDAGREVRVAVNISARNLADDLLARDVAAMLLRWGVPASCLELEMTESAILADPARARAVLQELADLGVTLAIDDFGAGYTSLGLVKDLPVHTLKIDRSFVSSMGTDGADAFIVRSLVDLGHHLGLNVVAEGVEDRRTADLLTAMGCDVAQGYLFSRPLPAPALEAWLDAHGASATGALETTTRDECRESLPSAS